MGGGNGAAGDDMGEEELLVAGVGELNAGTMTVAADDAAVKGDLGGFDSLTNGDGDLTFFTEGQLFATTKITATHTDIGDMAGMVCLYLEQSQAGWHLDGDADELSLLVVHVILRIRGSYWPARA